MQFRTLPGWTDCSICGLAEKEVTSTRTFLCCDVCGLILCGEEEPLLSNYRKTNRMVCFNWFYMPELPFTKEDLGEDEDIVRNYCKLLIADKQDELFEEIKKLTPETDELEVVTPIIRDGIVRLSMMFLPKLNVEHLRWFDFEIHVGLETTECALHVASRYGQVQTLKKILLNCNMLRSGHKEAFVTACKYGQKDVVRYILDNSRFSAHTLNHIAIRHAATYNHLELAEYLLQRDPKLDPSKYQNQALRIAMHLGHFDMARLLMKNELVQKNTKPKNVLEMYRNASPLYRGELLNHIGFKLYFLMKGCSIFDTDIKLKRHKERSEWVGLWCLTQQKLCIPHDIIVELLKLWICLYKK